MGFMDKLKNIFFEEEEEEEENYTPKKEVIVKKVEPPKRKIEDVHVEIQPNIIKEREVEIEKEIPQVEIKKEPSKSISDLIFDDEDFILETPRQSKQTKKEELYPGKIDTYKSRENRDKVKKEEVNVKKDLPKYEYQNREQQKSKTFTPSPIISPIYGILDRNYKKEEVKEKKDIRISSRPAKMDLDSVRNKAFGDLENDLFDNTPTKEEIVEKQKNEERQARDIKKIYDMTSKDKPSIEKVTIGEADEYFNDLGLAYNTDYKDISKEINDGKINENTKVKDEKLEDNLFDLIESMYDKED